MIVMWWRHAARRFDPDRAPAAMNFVGVTY
jgi:hypothetical protein